MTAVVPGFVRRDDRPPIDAEVAPAPGAAAVRWLAATERPWIEPCLGVDPGSGHHPADPAVRRYWTAVLGPGAVADLLRLLTAARTGRLIRRPYNLPALVAEGLVETRAETILVPPRVPYLGEKQMRRLSPRLRSEYRFLLRRAREAEGGY
jgi:hypothetical protein